MFIVFKKKKIIAVCICALFVFLSFQIFGKYKSLQTFFEAEGRTVIIDAGHGA